MLFFLYGEYLRYTDYIVLFTGSSLSDEEKAAKRQTAEDLLAQLNAGGDKENCLSSWPASTARRPEVRSRWDTSMRRGTLNDMELGGFYQKYLEKMSERAVEDATNTLQGAESSPSAQS